MTIKIHKSLVDYSSAHKIIETVRFRACSFAMDDGGRCLLDVISDPLLLQSFLESGSDDNSKDPQDGTSSESAVESPRVARYPQVSLSNVSSLEHVIEDSDQQMGYSYPSDGQGLLANASTCTIGMNLGSGTTLIVNSASSTYQHASSSKATIHHLPTSVQTTLQHSPVPARPLTPLAHSIRSPGQSSPSLHMPPPSPLQQTRSPLTSHAPSPAPSWSPSPSVLSPSSRTQPSVAFQSQVIQTTANVTQIVTALSQQNQKLNVQQPLLIHPQTSPIPSPQQPARLKMASSVATSASVPVTPSMVQIIPAPQANVPLPIRTCHGSVRPIQPKLPQQILPKPACSAANHFVTPAIKQANNTPVTASPRSVNVPLQSATASQLLIGQGQPGMFSGPQGTILLNSIIPGMGQSPILIQGNIGNLSNLQGLHLTLRPPVSATSSQSLSSSGTQNNPTLIAALQSPNQPAQTLFTQTKSPIHGQQTIVIPNNITQTGLGPQNVNLTSAIRNNTIVSSASQGQSFLARSNIILSSRVVGPNQGLQLQQIQTPQGPILALASSGTIALPHLPATLQNTALTNPQLSAGTLPLQGVVATNQSVISGLSLHSQHATLHQPSQHQTPSLFNATVPLTGQIEQSSSVVHLPQSVPAQHVAATLSASQSPAMQLEQQEAASPKPSSPAKPSKAPSVNLEELLKEHGIVPENTPPPSPDSQSPQPEESVPTHLQVHSPIVQSPQLIAALQSQHVVLEQLNQNSLMTSLPQMKLALAQDGSVIIQPHHAFIPTSRFSHSSAQAKVISSSNPTVTTSSVSVPVVTTQPCASRNHSTLLARLNSAPAFGIPEVVTSLALASNLGSCSSSSTTSTVASTAPMLIPITVQSLSVGHSPVTTSQIIQPINTVSSVLSGQIPIELCSSLSQSANHATSAVLNQTSIQSRLNHVIFGFQPLITSSHQHPTAVQTVTKTVPGLVSGSVSGSCNVLIPLQTEKGTKPEAILVTDSPDTTTPNRKLQTVTPIVPNDVNCNETDADSHTTSITTVTTTTAPTTTAHKNQKISIPVIEQEYLHSEKQLNLLKTNVTQNVQFVNILKPSSIQNSNMQAVVPIPVTAMSSTDTTRPTTVTQIITQVKTSKDSVQTVQVPQSVEPQVPSNSVKYGNIIHVKGKPVIRISSASKTALITKQLTVDQNYAVTPDTKTPFSSKQDACERLLKYHVYNSKVPSLEEMSTADQMFEKVSIQLLEKFRKMMNKYHLLHLKESMRPCPTPERVLLERLFQEDEQAALQQDKDLVAKGKSLHLPPPPRHWLEDVNIPSCSSKDREESLSPIKDDSDNLEAPVIDSCIDASSPQSDVGDRSPPTLKRIVIKTEHSQDADDDDQQSRKRMKTYCAVGKSGTNPTTWCIPNTKTNSKDMFENRGSRDSLKCFSNYQSDNKDDIVTKLRKELNMSPLVEENENASAVSCVDFEPPTCSNGMANFEHQVRTEGAGDSVLIQSYSNNARTNNDIKYDFDMLDCSTEWVDAYTNHVAQSTEESEAAVESILNERQNQSELDLCAIEGLEGQLDDSHQSIPNGIREEEGEESADSEIQYISYSIPKSHVAENESLSNEMQDQVQSAIKSILELQSDNRSYFDGDDSDIMPRLYELEKTHDSRKHRISPISYVSLDGNIGVSETDAALDEAVRSILQ